jgi:cell wall-associated NlpC family hydrolase
VRWFELVLALTLATAVPVQAASPAEQVARLRRAQAGVDELLLGKRVAVEARRLLGTPYHWGGDDPRGFDCSGLTRFVFSRIGVALPKRAAQQSLVGRPVERGAELEGDLVFFASSSAAASMHVGIYDGAGWFIHAPGTGKRVRRSRLEESYFRNRYLGARRVASVQPQPPLKR